MLAISLYLQQQRRAAAAAAATPAASNSPVGSYIPSPSSGGLSGAIGGAIVGGVASAAATAANVATAAGAAGVRDLSWQGAGTAPAAGSAAAAGGALSPAVSSPRAGGQQQQQPHASGAPNSGSGGGSAIALNPSALLGRGREADAAFASALEAYQRRASEDSAAAAAGYGGRGGGGAAASSPPAARLGARAALLYADVAAAAAEDLADRAGPRSGLAGAGEELQAQAEEALLNASVLETPLCAAVLLEVSANRCREAGRLRRAAFRLIQAGHMYKTFAKDSGEAYRQQQQQQQGGSAAAAISIASPKFVGMHAARCFLGSLSGYSGSGWLAAEEYACTVLPTELRALQRPVAALQLYVRLVSAAGARREGRNAAIAGGGSSGALAGSSTHSQQQQQQKRAAREASLMVTFEDLCWRYPDAARVAARAWERGRETSKLDMSFFPITDRARGPPPPSRKAPAAAPTATPNSPHSNADLLGIDFDSSGEAEAEEEASGDGGGLGGGLVTAGVGEGVVFEELALPGVVHEETRPVDTENASVEASVKVTDGASWAQDMADALKAELAAADAVRAGEGPWLTLSASYGHKAGTLSSSSREPSSSSAKKPSHLPPPPRSAPVGEPVTVLVMLENLLAVPVTVEDLQLVLTAPAAAGEGQEEEEVACMALDEEEFQKTYSPKPATGEEALMDMLASSPPTPATAAAAATDATAAAVAIERRRATVPPGERLPVLLKFCALRPATAALTVSSVRWTVFQWNGGKEAGGTGEACPRVWVSHRLEGRGKLLHATLEQRAAKARAPAPPPRFEATGSMPWLGCSLEGVPPTLLQGEVVRATLNVTNRGRAPAGHLCLKTNLPWVAFEEPSTATIGGDEASATGGGATGGAVGASGTTLAPPVGVIMPGQSVALPLWVRGRGGGRQTVRMIVRYKRAPPSSSSSPSSAEGGGGERDGEWGVVSPSSDKLFRLERHAPVSLEMCVLPSLSVAASVLPSYSRRGEYVLSLEATNYRSNGDEAQGNRHLRIHKVCAISRCWRMEPLAGVPSKEEGGVGAGAGGSDEGGTIVHWQERITLHYRLFPVEGGDVIDGEEAPSVRHNDCTLGGTGTTTADWPGSEDSPHLPLLCLEQAASNYYQACRKHRQQKLAEEAAAADEQPRTIQGVRKERERENAIEALKKEEEDEERRWRTQRRAHPTSPDALCAPDVSLVHLMVLWGLDGSGDAPARVGQHHVRSLVIRPERVDRQCPLVLTVKYPSEVTWDGSSHVGAGEEGPRGCDAEVTVCATNRLAGPRENAKVNFTFEVRADDGPRRLSTVPGAPPPQASGGGGQGTSNKRPPRNRFVWLGPTRRRVVGLGPGEATTIPLKVRFLRPGVFDLNRFRFVVEFAPAAAASGKGKPATALPPSIPNTQQQRRDSSSSQQGRVTFVFPAQYLVTVAPSPPLPRPSSAVKTNKALVGAGGGMSPGSPALEEILVA
ncbi:conserved unknown protein [Ectocarpus siliculosus]|uniref:Uncharacterized protein n=1 Tax=Ectocarpus siliculosus TaxID=2880 RepID=D7FQP4_ECTSI|nr:conserved unknown protein [Ectocarpus siliculosus]|eukprot:CBJ30639.1 conserved unknown protein [Ectocarpus siliculosus]